MDWKRYFRFRHFYHSINFLIRDHFLVDEPVLIQPKTLLIVKLDAIGDYLFVRNFLALTRKSDKFKDYKITLCGNELWRDLAEHFDSNFVDEFIWINKRKFGTDKLYRKNMLSQIRFKGYEYAIQPTYSRDLLWGDSIIKSSCAKHKIGSKGDMANDSALFKKISDHWFTQLIQDNDNVIFEFDRNRIFFEKVLEEKITLQKPFIENAKGQLNKYIVLFPGAGEKIKQWHAKNFAGWINLFRQTHSMDIYICGSASDSVLAEEIIAFTDSAPQVINYCGQTNLPQLINFINDASLLITNDSSAFHIGALQNTPTVCMLMGRHYGRFAPYPEGTCPNLITLYPKRFLDEIENNPNIFQSTQYTSPYSINEIEVDEVINAGNKLLK